MNKVLSFFFLLVLPILLMAQQEGSLDSSFGSNGSIANSYFSNKKTASSSVLKTIVGANNKTYLYGSATNGNANGVLRLSMTCLNEDGSTDSSFGNNGRVYFAPNTYLTISANIFSIQVDSLNRIIFGLQDHSILRFLSTGFSDTGFGVNGYVKLTISGFATTTLTSLLVQTDGKIVCVGKCLNPGIKAVITRFNVNGTLDNSFNNTGKVLGVFNTGSYNNEVKSHFILNDGKIVVVGNAYNQYNSDFASSRYLPNGTLDSSYGNNGITKINYDYGDDLILHVAATKQNGILIRGTVAMLTGSTLTIFTKFLANGRVDSTFGSAGKFVLSTSTSQIMSWKNDGILLWTLNSGEYTLKSYLKTGAIDSAFGKAGTLTLAKASFPLLNLSGLGVLDNDQLVFGGYNDQLYYRSFGFIKINQIGVIDTTIGQNGLLHFQMGETYYNIALTSKLSKIAVRPDKKLVAVGSGMEVSTSNMLVLWFEPNGERANSIGNNGQILLEEGMAKAVLPLADNAVLVAGYLVQTGIRKAILLKLKANGTYDSSFGVNGRVVVNKQLANGINEFNDIDLQSDGKIIVTGSGIGRFLANGEIDSSFGLFGFNESIYGTNSVVLKDNAIVVAGDSTLSKFSANGRVKIWSYIEKWTYSCSSPGKSIILNYAYYEPYVDIDDNIFVRGGKYFDPEYNRYYICFQNGGDVQFLFNKNGVPISSFGTNGKIINTTTTLKTGTLSLGHKALCISKGNTNDSYVLYKNLSNGSPDGPFGNAGKILFYQSKIKLGNPSSYLYHNAFQNDSSVIVAFLQNDSLFFAKHFIRKDETVNFTLSSKNIGLLSDTFRLTATGTPAVTSFRWSIPGAIYVDGTDSNSVSPAVVFSTWGYKSISLNGIGIAGQVIDTRVKSNLITVCHVDFNSTLTFGAVADPIQLIPNVFPLPSSYRWEIEGNPVFYPGYNLHVQTPYFRYLETGTYTVKLTIKLTSGDSFSTSKTNFIRINSLSFTQDKSSNSIDSALFRFYANSSPAALRYLWSAKGASGQLGNPITITGKELANATIIASDTGWYDVQLKAFYVGSDSLVVVKNKAIYVSVEPITNKPIAKFSVSKRVGNVDDLFYFYDSSSYFPNAWEWTFTPNNVWLVTSDYHSQNPLVSFYENGSYEVKLKATNSFGSDSIIKSAYIQIGPVGLAEPKRNSEVHVFPNPAKDQLFVQFLGKETPKIEIFNALGVLVYQDIYLANNLDKMEINTSQLPEGIYHLRICTKEKDLGMKFILLR